MWPGRPGCDFLLGCGASILLGGLVAVGAMLGQADMAPDSPWPERRRYRRLRAPILVRPVSALARRVKPKPSDISLGGLRAYCDEEHKPGTRLELELLLPDEVSVTVLAEVVWVMPLAEGAPARFDVGLRFVDVPSEGLGRIARALSED